MKKLLKVLGVIIILIFVALLVVPMIFKDDIVKLVKDETNKAVTAKVDFGEFDLSLIRSFPNFFFSIKDLSVNGVDEFQGVELARIKELSLTVDLMSVINGESIQVNQILIDEPSIHAKVLANGKANYMIVAEDSAAVEEVEAEVESSQESNFKLALKKVQIKNASIIYDDVTLPVHLDIADLNLDLKGDMTQNLTNLATKVTIDKFNLNYDGIAYMKNVELVLDAIIEMNLEEFKFTFDQNELRINELPLGFDGWIAMPNDPIEMDISFEAKETDFKEILSLIPASFTSDLTGVKTAGTLALNGYAKGTYLDSIYPAFGLNMQVDDAMFQYPDLPKSVTDIQIKAAIESKDGNLDNTIIDVPTFHLQMADNPFDLNFYLATPISDPFIKAGMKGKLILDKLKEVIPLEKGDELTGVFTADVSLEGNLSTLEQERYEEFKAEGTILAEKIHYVSDSLDYPVDLNKASLSFTPQYAELKELNMKLGKSDLSAQGQLENFIGYALKDNQTLKGKLNLQSSLLDINELAGIDPENETTATEASTDTTDNESPMEVVLVPKNIDFVTTASIKQLVYDNMIINDIEGEVSVKDERIAMENTTMKLIGGTMAMNGYYETTDALKPTYDFEMDINDFDLEESIQTFNTVEQLAPIAKNGKGAYSTMMSVSGQMNQQMDPLLNSINGKGSLRTQNIRLEGYEPLQKVSKLIKYDELDPFILNDVNITFTIVDGKVIVDPFTNKIGETEITIAGSNSFDQTIDYVFSFAIPREEFGSGANDAVEGLFDQASAKGVDLKLADVINIDVQLKGPATNPKITTDFSKAKSNATEAIKDKVKEEIDKKKKELEEKAKEEIEKQKEELEKKKKELEDKAKQELESQKKRAEEEAEKAKKKAAEEAKKKLKGLFD